MRSHFGRVLRQVPVWLAGLVLMLTAGSIALLSINVAQIETALPVDSLYRQRDVAALLQDIQRLEIELRELRRAPAGTALDGLSLALDLVILRHGDAGSILAALPVDGAPGFSGRLEASLKALEQALALDAQAIPSLVGHVADVHRLGKDLRVINDALFQISMEQATAQRAALSALQRGISAMVVLLGVFGLALIVLLRRQQAINQAQLAAQEEIRNLAFFDPLTGLPNRRLLIDRLRHTLAIHARQGKNGALLFIDLDNFKNLNDTRGHAHGDELLREVAQRLVRCVRDSDTVARLGGDEFVLMLEDLGASAEEAADNATAAGQKILESLNHSYPLSGGDTHSTPSIGVALFGAAEADSDELLKRADLAMYQAKEAGRNTLRFYDPVLQSIVAGHLALESDLRRSLREGGLALHYQPQVDRAGRVIGAEALTRWQHPERGAVPPAQFIPLAERSGLILPLGRWVLEAACRQLVRWQGEPATAQLTMSVNVSARQFRHPDFVGEVESALRTTGAPASQLKLELTESLLLEDVEEAIVRMELLQRRGVAFSLDDFGTGYSSLAYLKRLPLQQLKIDRSFVRDVLTDPNDAVIARTIIALGQSLGLELMAEGVETVEQRDFLLQHGCDAFQGYLFGRPATELHIGDRDIVRAPA